MATLVSGFTIITKNLSRPSKATLIYCQYQILVSLLISDYSVTKFLQLPVILSHVITVSNSWHSGGRKDRIGLSTNCIWYCTIALLDFKH